MVYKKGTVGALLLILFILFLILTQYFSYIISFVCLAETEISKKIQAYYSEQSLTLVLPLDDRKSINSYHFELCGLSRSANSGSTEFQS